MLYILSLILNIFISYSYSVTIKPINIFSFPFDSGSNFKGSALAPDSIVPKLNFLNIKNKYKVGIINTRNQVRKNLYNGYLLLSNLLNINEIALNIGGDHTIAIPTIFASNDFCIKNNETLGVLWCDAHADFNTMYTSETKNLHGMPVAVLCGHTLNFLQYSKNILNPSQFAYYGLRDIDFSEYERCKHYKMKALQNIDIIKQWISKYDRIHLSFDLDSIDPNVFYAVNTPVDYGLNKQDVIDLFKLLKNSNKLISIDIVEYNPIIKNDDQFIIDILSELIN